MVIAIDGPAGAGKTTVAKALANELGFTYIDTGAMYRAITYKALKMGVNLEEKEAVARLAKETEISLEGERIWVDGEDVSNGIRTPLVSRNVSKVASNLGVRRHLVEIQRRLTKGLNGVVVEGRDIGSVVFPDARWKFYLDAGLEVRARRRYNELREMGEEVNLEALKEEIKVRDTLDISRKESPLIKEKDAIYIDTTSMTIDEVILRIKGFIGVSDKGVR
jgi:cytidylate kinase